MSSGKTIAALIWCLSYAQKYQHRLITITTSSYPTLRTGVMRDWKNIITSLGFDYAMDYSATANVWTYKPTDTQIEFMALDDPLKARGARRDVLFVNEANRITYDLFDQMTSRTRGVTIIDYNPSSRFWAHDILLRDYRDECNFFISTYLDNSALSSTERENIERHDRSSNWWRVYGLGHIGELENNIYSGWQTVYDLPSDARLILYGLDFGDSPDPTAMVGIYHGNDGYYFRQLYYKKAQLIDTMVADIKSIVSDCGDKPIICDYGGGGSVLVRSLQAAHLRAVKADKAAGSVLIGINELQNAQNVHILGRDLEREYLSYQHRTSRTGEVLPEPRDGDDHLLDALRYGYHIMTVWKMRSASDSARLQMIRDITNSSRWGST